MSQADGGYTTCSAAGCCRKKKCSRTAPGGPQDTDAWHCWQHLSLVGPGAGSAAATQAEGHAATPQTGGTACETQLRLVRCGVNGCRRTRRADRLQALLGFGASAATPWHCWQHLSSLRDDTAATSPELQGDAAPPPPSCDICSSTGNATSLMLCEFPDCGGYAHTFCAVPPMPFVPTGAWYCEAHASEGPVELYPEPGTKVMVLVRKELRWWPAVVLPSDAAYLPDSVPRKAGGMLEGRCRTFKVGFSSRRHRRGAAAATQLSQSTTGGGTSSTRHAVVAYYGQPLRQDSEVAALRLDWDKVRALDFSADAFASPTPALAMALNMARLFDLDPASGDKLRFTPSAAATPLGPRSLRTPQEAMLYHLTLSGTTLQSFCAERGLQYSIARAWLGGAGGVAGPAEEPWLQAALEVAADLGVAPGGTLEGEGEGEGVHRSSSTAPAGRSPAGSPAVVAAGVAAEAPGSGCGSWRITKRKRKASSGGVGEAGVAVAAAAGGRKRSRVQDVSRMFERRLAPLGALLLKLLNAKCRGAVGDDLEPVRDALLPMHGIDADALESWVHGRTADPAEAAYIDRVAKHVLTWNLGEAVVTHVEHSGLSAIPRVLDVL